MVVENVDEVKKLANVNLAETGVNVSKKMSVYKFPKKPRLKSAVPRERCSSFNIHPRLEERGRSIFVMGHRI